ncbi:MAG: hypothetical protein ACPLUL_01930 [Thermanaerothrix sp.]|uniref:hypothetical protein n=1 Tax=Thermanaerothrix sp. TaxID=2972675 RepID=UPI003C7B576E
MAVLPEQSPRDPDLLWNVLTLLVWLGIFGVILFVGLIYINPHSPLNPFPPRPVPTLLVLPTQEVSLESTSNLTETPTATLVPTAVPTFTPTPQPTLVEGTPLPEVASTATPTPSYGYAFAVQNQPNVIAASLYHPERTCDWMGVAGRVFDLQGRPAVGIRVWLRGYLGGKMVNLFSLTGTASLYGPSGYEFTLADAPIASRGALGIQLLDQADLPLSPQITFDTYDDCEKNLILIDFKQVR